MRSRSNRSCSPIPARYVLLRVTIRGIPLSELIRPPWRRYVVESRLPRELLLRRLKHSVQPVLWFARSRTEPLEGTVTADGFKLRPAGRSPLRRDFLTLAVGRFTPSAYGTRVEITIRPVLPQLALWLIAFAAVALVGILAAHRALRGDPKVLAVEPLVIAFLAYMYFYLSIVFALRLRKVKPMLDEVLSGGPEMRLTP